MMIWKPKLFLQVFLLEAAGCESARVSFTLNLSSIYQSLIVISEHNYYIFIIALQNTSVFQWLKYPRNLI